MFIICLSINVRICPHISSYFTIQLAIKPLSRGCRVFHCCSPPISGEIHRNLSWPRLGRWRCLASSWALLDKGACKEKGAGFGASDFGLGMTNKLLYTIICIYICIIIYILLLFVIIVIVIFYIFFIFYIYSYHHHSYYYCYYSYYYYHCYHCYFFFGVSAGHSLNLEQVTWCRVSGVGTCPESSAG